MVSFIDKLGRGNTLLILTDAESRLIRRVLFPEPGTVPAAAMGLEACEAFNRGIARGTAKMAEESKAEFKARVKK